MKKPEMMTKEHFDKITPIEVFNKYHNTNFTSWLGIIDITRSKEVEGYTMYVEWYVKTYTKLGRALQ